ncbi:MAG: hypothetical protein J2P43_01555, partial [Candidatus Dormibacteraeota bacterium]|nr:hypothetical protein [Candidatus Dormibacteraeota bacterium]
MTADVEPTVRDVRLTYVVAAGGATVSFTRIGPSGVTSAIRGWVNRPATPNTTVAPRDFEAPIGVPITYTAQTLDASGAVIDTETVTITIPSQGCGDTWLNDLARTQNTMRVLIETLPELDYPVPNSVHEIITRRAPIVSSDIAHTPQFELSFITDTLDQRDRARATLGNGVPVLLRTPPEDGIGNLYLAVLGFKEQRMVTRGVEDDRRFVVTGRQVERPDPILYVPGAPTTYDEVKARFATYQDLKDQRVNYDAVLYDWTGEQPSD